MERQPWYADGLRFRCTQCGQCCRGAPGNVWLTEREAAALAAQLGLTPEAFRRRYTRRRKWHGIRLAEKANLDCIFYRPDGGCTVYALRPRQCRTWPFWRRVLASPATWAEAARDCPGIDRGRLYRREEIERRLADDGLPDGW